MSVNIYEAKTRLSQLVAEVERTGAEVTISRHGVPVAELVPFRPVVPPRQLGSWRGRVEFSADFDELPDDVAAAFSGALP